MQPIIDAKVYLEKGTVPTKTPAADYFVNELIKTIEHSNRNITMDNWFSSLSMLKESLQNNLTVIPTVKINKSELPNKFTDKKFQNRQTGSSMFLFDKYLIAVSYKANWKMIVFIEHNE